MKVSELNSAEFDASVEILEPVEITSATTIYEWDACALTFIEIPPLVVTVRARSGLHG